MSFILNSLKSCVNNLKILNNFTQNMARQNIEYLQTRTYKYEIFHHSRGLMSNDLAQRGKHYNAKVMKRMNTHGLSKRLETRGGKQILWRKLLRGPSGWVTMVAAP